MTTHVDLTDYKAKYTDKWAGVFEFPIIYAQPDTACEACGDPAVYELDAQAELGMGGHNVTYCQTCLEAQVYTNGPTGDVEYVAAW